MDRRERFYALVYASEREALLQLQHLGQNAIRAEVWHHRYVVIGPTNAPSHWFVNGGPLYEGDTRETVLARLVYGQRLRRQNEVEPSEVAGHYPVVARRGPVFGFDVRPLAELMAGWAYSILLGAPGVDYSKMPEGERQMWESKAAEAIRYVIDLTHDQVFADINGPPDTGDGLKV